MVKTIGIDELNALGRRWERWTDLVGLFALRHKRRHALDPSEYRTLSAQLVESCRRLAEQCDSGQKARFRQLEEILLPWVSLDSLVLADHEIVYQLHKRCLLAQRMFGPGQRTHDNRRWAKHLFLLAGSVLALIVLLLAWHDALAIAAGPLRTTWRWGERVGRVVVLHGTNSPALIIGITGTLLIMAIVWRAARRD